MRLKYIKSYRDRRTWKQRNRGKVRAENREQKERNQNETLPSAVKRKRPWTEEEIETLRNEGSTLTIIELAIKLGRTYFAVQMKAFHEGIDLHGDEN